VSKKRIHWAWVILAVCFFDLFFNYSIRLGFGVILPEMIQSLELNRTQGGGIINFYLAAYICVTPLTGNLTDRLGARPVITAFCLVLGVSTILMGTVNGFWTACLFFALVGVGASAMWTPVITLVQRWYAPTRRGMALGVLSTGYGLGFAAMGWFFPLLVPSFSWRLCWYMLGGCVLIMSLFNALFLRSRPEDLQQRPWGRQTKETAVLPDNAALTGGSRLRDVFVSSQFWIIGTSYLFTACAVYMVTTFMVDYANMELGFTFKDASFLATIHGLSQVVGVLTIPLVSDRIGRKRTIIGINAFIAMSIIGIIASGHHASCLYGSIAVLGAFYGAIWPMYGACGGDYFRMEIMGTVIGAWTPFYGLGAISAHLIGGRIRDVTQSFHWAFILAITFGLISVLLMTQLKATLGDSPTYSNLR
jgi:sugar phosphate permease